MEFSASETQTMLRETAERLVRDRYGFEERKKIIASDDGYSPALWREFASLGLLGVEVPEDFDGSGGGFDDIAVVLEALGQGLVVEPYLSTVVLGAGLIAAAGTTAQKQDVLPRVASGELLLALAHGEPHSRYALNYVETTARRDGTHFIVDGKKAVVLGGDSAGLLIVSARTSGKLGDPSGISLFLVERQSAGVSVRAHPNVDDRRAAEIGLEGVRVSEAALLGPLDGALPLIEAAFDRGAAALCCEAVGAMGALNALTLDYLKTRNQFGRPIGKFQVLQHRMADMVMAEQQARSMLYLAIENAGEPDAAARRQAISAAKVQINKSAQVVGRGAVQLHGGIAMTMEYIAGHYFRRLTAVEKMMGDTDYHLTRFSEG
jgi:alkylation response protein AidB-like acyl-CoA dehydrogenase